MHVMTWDSDDQASDAIKVSPAQAAPYVDVLLTVPSTSAAVKAAGIKSALYFDPNRVNPDSPMWNNNQATFAHDCKNNLITVQDSNDLLMNVENSTLWSLWVNAVQVEESWGAVWDWIFEDSADEIQTQKLSAQPCNFNQTTWTNDTNSMDATLALPIVYNGLGLIPPGDTTSPGPSIGLNPTTQGGMSEDCYAGRTPTGYFFYPHWAATENSEIQMHEDGKLFVCQSDWYDDASTSVGQRMYQYASYLLTYDLNTMYYKTSFLTPSAVHVMPESELVALDPAIATPSNVSGLMLSSGLYGREYRECFIATKYVGPCAAVVNPNNPNGGKPLAFPWPTKYHHTLLPSGEGWYDGGTISPRGPAPSSTIAGGTGLIVFP